MKDIDAYIGFNGKCREAMSFYKECFGGELTLLTVGGSPMESQCPPAMKDQILHSALVIGDVVLMGTDMTPPEMKNITESNIALSIECSSEEEINRLFEKLSIGGKVIHKIEKMFWGGKFAVVVYKFKVRLMFNFSENPE